MNFSQLHERLRLEVLRRIDRGALTSAMLAHQTGFTPSHISNFLNRKRKLSLEALDKVLQSQSLTVADLLPEDRSASNRAARNNAAMHYDSVPLVEPSVAILNARISSSSILQVVKIGDRMLSGLRDKCSAERRKWDRFVAVQITEEESRLLQPFLPNAILLIDRHYNSAVGYSGGRRSIYAVRSGSKLRFRYVALIGRHLVLTAHDPAHIPELVPLSESQTSADLLVGRVFLAIVEL